MKNSRKCMVLLGLVVFAATAYFVFSNNSITFDKTAWEALVNFRKPLLNRLLVIISYSGNVQVILPLCVVLLLLKPTRFSYGIPLGGSALFSSLLYEAVKYIFRRPRPFSDFWLLTEHGFSFPSGHSLNNMVFWGTALMLLTYYNRTQGASIPFYGKTPHPTKLYIKSRRATNIVRILICIHIAMIGFSRLYVGVHWITDVIAGFSLGVVVLAFSEAIFLSEH